VRLILIVTFFIFGCLLNPFTSQAAFNATDVLGQFNADGSPNFTNGLAYGQALSAVGFGNPGGIVVDDLNHRLYVADGGNCRILVFDLNSSNILEDDTADYVLGGSNFTEQFCSDAVTPSNFYENGATTQLALDIPGQRLFVSDSGNYRVLVFDVSTVTNGEAAVNVLGAPDLVTAGEGTVSGSNLGGGIGGMVFDVNNGRLFIADGFMSRVVVFDLSGGVTNGMDASYVLGQPDFDTEGGDPDFVTASTTVGSAGVAYDPDTEYLYVGSYAGSGGRVTVFDVNPGTLTQNNPDAIYVIGQADFTATSTTVDAATFSSLVNSIDLDVENKRLYAGTSNRVLVFDVATITNGESAVSVLGQNVFTEEIDKKNSVLSADSYATDAATFGGPYVHYFEGKLYVSDSSSNRVLVFDVSTVTNGEAAVDVIGQKENGVDSFTKPLENNADASLGFGSLGQAVIDEVGHRLFVLDNQSRVLVFNLDSNNRLIDKTPDYVLGSDSLYREAVGGREPNDIANGEHIAYSSKHKLLFVQGGGEQYGIRVFDLSGGISTNMAASYIIGASDFNSNGGGETANRFYAYDIVVDDINDYLYVHDANNFRGVLVFDISNGVTTGMSASYILGESSLIGATGGSWPTVNTLSSTKGTAFDPDSKYLYVGDGVRVVVYDLSSGISTGMSASYVLGQNGFTGAIGGTTQNKFERVEGLALDIHNKLLYVSDGSGSQSNYRIMVFDVSEISNGENAVAVIGRPNFTEVGEGVASASSFVENQEISFASTTRTLLVNDSGIRVLFFNLIDFVSDSLPAATVGAAYTGGFTATSSQGTVTYSLISGTLPDGLSLNESTGVISGTPTTATSSVIQIRVTDTLSAAQVFYHTQSFTLTVSEPPAQTPTPTAPPSNGPIVISSGGGGGFAMPGTVKNYIVPNQQVVTPTTPAIGQATQPTQTPGQTPTFAPTNTVTSYSRNLSAGARGEDVRNLQKLLNSLGFAIAKTGPGSPGNETNYYGTLTAAAVKRLQEANREMILSPFGLSSGTGFFGPATRKYLEGLRF
jgi:DNA-binding beta-propeller fold protein YncE